MFRYYCPKCFFYFDEADESEDHTCGHCTTFAYDDDDNYVAIKEVNMRVFRRPERR